VGGFVAALRRAVSVRPLVIAGHSLGGAIALSWALQHPDEVRGLILIGAGARTRVNPAWLDGIARKEAAVIEEFGSLWFGTGAGARLRDKSLALLRATPPDVLLADLRSADGFDVTQDLHRLAVPALILCGVDDRLTPVKYSRDLQARIRGSVLEIIEGAGHMVMLEQPQVVNAFIRRFLEGLDGGVTP
jgi:pimeloyl-ACP methyl ester carboxylesterase